MQQSDKTLFLVLASLAALLAGFAFYFKAAPIAVAVLAFVFCGAVVWRRMEWGVYIMAALYPFTYFQFVSGSINAQYIDLIAMTIGVLWGLRTLYELVAGRTRITARWFPIAIPMMLFVTSGALSLLSVEVGFLALSVKYLLRPILFFYILFVFLPGRLITHEHILATTHRVMYWTGIFVSGIGVWSLIFPPIQGVFRAIPVPVFGIQLLGPNHNLIAEVLVMLIPIGYILFTQTRNIFMKNLYLLGTFLMIAVTLLTFSRAGWIAVAITGFLLALLQYRDRLHMIIRSYGLYIGLVLIAPLAYLMYQLATSVVAISSNLNRLKLITIAYDLFREHPLVGNGVGTFTRLISDIQWYIIEYGEPLDAHGVYFKVLAEQGVLGVITWTVLMGAIIYTLYRSFAMTRNTRWGIIMVASLLSVIAGFTFQLFGTAYYLSKLWFPIGIALAASRLAHEHASHQQKN